MRMTIESTDLITRIDGVPARLWKGELEDGSPCDLLIHLRRVPHARGWRPPQ